MTTTAKSTHEVLRDARQVLVGRGRCRVVLMAHDGRVCPLGAIGLAIGLSPTVLTTPGGEAVYRPIGTHPATQALVDCLPDHHLLLLPPGERTYQDVYHFSDWHGVTDAEVLALFDCAIEATKDTA